MQQILRLVMRGVLIMIELVGLRKQVRMDATNLVQSNGKVRKQINPNLTFVTEHVNNTKFQTQNHNK